MVRRLVSLQICLLLISTLPMVSCKRADHAIMGNEGLRLTPEEIKTSEDAASQGDAAAAKKLWHHYEFVVYDHEKGEMWREKYEKLSKGETKK